MQTFVYLYCVYIYISAKILYYAKQNKKKELIYEIHELFRRNDERSVDSFAGDVRICVIIEFSGHLWAFEENTTLVKVF